MFWQRVLRAVVAATPALVVLGPGPVRAQSAYFLDVYHDGALVSGSANPVPLQPGIPATFAVYLREQVPTGGTSGLAANGGLFGGGVRSGFNNTGAGPLHLPEASAGTAIQVNPGFATVSRAVDATSAGFEANVGFTGGTPLTPDAQGRILLGSFTYQTPNAGADTVVFSDLPSPGTFVYGNGTNFDQLVTGSTVAVTPVPEPAALLGVSTVALGLTLLRSRRRSVGRPHSEGDRCPGTRG